MKPVSFKEFKERALENDEVRAAYEEADRELAVLEALHAMREHAKLTRTELARRLEISPAALSRLEKNPLGASMKTLARYASACGADISLSVLYK